MKKFAPILLLLASCTAAQVTTATDDVAIACSAARPFVEAASLVPGIPASIAAYLIAGCDTAAGLARLRADPASVAWIEGNVAKLRALLGR